MKVAVTSRGPDTKSVVDPRFGRAKFIILIDTETGESTTHDNTQNLNAVQGAGIQAARNVVSLGAAAVITGSVGPKAFAALRAANVETYLGATGLVRDAVEQFKGGEMECATQANIDGHWR